MPRQKTPDLMGQLLAGKKPDPHQTFSIEHPEAKGDMKTFSLRMPEGDRDLLRRYFRTKGMDLSNGLRMWIYERMQKEGLTS